MRNKTGESNLLREWNEQILLLAREIAASGPGDAVDTNQAITATSAPARNRGKQGANADEIRLKMSIDHRRRTRS